MRWKVPEDIPLEILYPLVKKISLEKGIDGRDGFCTEHQDTAVEELKQRLGPDAAHFKRENLAKCVLNHGKQGRLRFNESKNNGARSYEDIESDSVDHVYERLLEPDWRALSEECKRRAGYRCQLCNAKKSRSTPLHAHHRTYDSMRTEQEIDDLIALCKSCHIAHHKRMKESVRELF